MSVGAGSGLPPLQESQCPRQVFLASRYRGGPFERNLVKDSALRLVCLGDHLVSGIALVKV